MYTDIKYNKQIYPSGPVSFNEFMTNKYEVVHQQIYSNALAKLIQRIAHDNGKSEEDIRHDFKFNEIRANEYWEISKIIITVLSTNYADYSINGHKCIKGHKIRYTFTEEEWNNEYCNRDKDDVVTIKNTLEKIQDPEVIYIDYIKGMVTIQSRIDDITFDVPFSFLNADIKISEDYSLDGTILRKIYR